MDTFSSAAGILQRPTSVGVIPTDTVYGLVASAHDAEAINRLYSLKSRNAKPGTVIAASIDQLSKLGLKHRYLQAVIDYWPGQISIIIPCGPELSYIHQGVNSIAVRVPADEQLVEFLEETGPLVTSSANHPNEPVAATIKEAQKYFGDKVEFYVDGGDLSDRQPSTIIRIVDDAVEVLREGAVKIENNAVAR